MHISIAKAKLKGEFREVKQRLRSTEDELNQITDTKSVSKKLALQVMEALHAVCGPFNIYHTQESRRSSWHTRTCTFYICPDSTFIEGFGDVYPIGARLFDTRRYMKSAATGDEPFKDYTSRVVLHEHFLLRLRQRSGIDSYESLKTSMAYFVVGAHLYFAARETSFDAQTSSEESKSHCYLLLKQHVLIGTHHIAHGVIVLNTVINRDRFTENQRAKYEPKYRNFEDQGFEGGFFNEDHDFFMALEEGFLSHKLIKQVAEAMFFR